MNTIDELMKDKKPGEIKLVSGGAGDIIYFIPYFSDTYGFWNGLYGDKFSAYFSGSERIWDLYQEPKEFEK